MRASMESKALLEVIKNDKFNAKNMKDSKWDNYKIDDYSKIKSLLKSDEYFLGIRENYVNIYYKGMSMARIDTYWNRACEYTLSSFYAKKIPGYEDKKDEVTLTPCEFWNEKNQDAIKDQIWKHVSGRHGEHDHKLRLEKVCQQWIINKNNANESSEWYFVDMEYIYKDKESHKSHPYGRADLIAIRRRPNINGKHDVAFVELKVGTKAYSGSRDSDEKMEILKKSLYDKKVDGIKLGSGLSSHMVDFMHFFAKPFYVNQVKSELIGILKWHKEFGLISEESSLGKLNSESQIEDKPSIHIVTYSSVPGVKIDNVGDSSKRNYPKASFKSMKQSFYDYMYNSDMAFVDIVHEDDIADIVNLKEAFADFVDSKEKQISCLQSINGEKYEFVFRFIDVVDENNNAACIE